MTNRTVHDDGGGYQDWPWTEVIVALLRRGVTLSDLARATRLDPTTFAHCKTKPNARAQRAIAQAIGLSPLAVWPTRYCPDTGRPLSRAEWRAQNSGRPSAGLQPSRGGNNGGPFPPEPCAAEG